MINIIIDCNMDQILISGTNDLGTNINEIQYDCRGMKMSQIQKIIYEIINLISPTNVEVNLYKRDEDSETLIESW